ncbi:GNAT family N-acetyltransferase [Myxococcota bacterium]|nr:GNAT family N-acetyltransferase [Myxococcota bacterium]
MSAALREAGLRAQALVAQDCEAVLAYLRCHPQENLLLIDQVESIVSPRGESPEIPPQVIVVRRGDTIEGVAGLRPSMILDWAMTEAGFEGCLPILGAASAGLIKSPRAGVERIWRQLRLRGRKALLDRGETGWVRSASISPPSAWAPPPPAILRPAVEGDLAELVEAARGSLREEGRPDPFRGDPDGFRRWVRGRLPRARVVALGGKPVFVGYADVRRSEGWLIQGVYCWPEHRRAGYARAGMAGMIQEAFAAGAGHVQLAVVEGNDAAKGLYSSLGFEPFCELRTILFA